uniref:Putative secreted protein n=1 Tax=Xenopsylla cheopis TaxID=163159 RepID=A0A6M2E464_XENCH
MDQRICIFCIIWTHSECWLLHTAKLLWTKANSRYFLNKPRVEFVVLLYNFETNIDIQISRNLDSSSLVCQKICY